MLALATPVVTAELAWVTMGIVDTIMVGGLGPNAIGAVGLASMLFFAVAVFAMGLLLGLDPLVAQSFGARRLDECHRWLVARRVAERARHAADDGRGLRHARARSDDGACRRPCSHWPARTSAILTWSLPPLLCYVAFRRYLQAMNVVRPVMFALVAANLVNGVANWILIYGHFGAPAMGVRGSAYATLAGAHLHGRAGCWS